MLETFPPIHPCQAKVEQLRADLLAAGTPLTHAEALQRVAEAEGEKSWSQLRREPPAHWLARLLGWRSGWRCSVVVHVDELLFDLRTDRFRVGLSPSQLAPMEQDLSASRRHVLVVGPNGKGATSALDYYAGQQLAMGGGLLVLGASPNEDSPYLLGQVAEACGRSDFTHYRADLPEADRLPSPAALVRGAGAAYVSLPWGRSRAQAQLSAEALIEQLDAVGQSLPRRQGEPRAHPFMVVVPDGGWLLTDAWQSLLQNARSYNIMLVVRLHSLADLQDVSETTVESVLNFGTKLFLQPASPASIETASKVLALSQDPDELAAARSELAALGLGEALLAGADEPTQVKLCMLVPVTRAQAWERREGVVLG
jgi:hypothetical protein